MPNTDSRTSNPRPVPRHTIYLRKTDKNGIKIDVPPRMMLWELQHLVASELGIANHRQVLFINSNKFHKSSNKLLELRENTIIHVH